jgi:hypothetical protein
MSNQPQSSGGHYHSYDVKLATRLKSLEMSAMAFHFQYWIKHNATLGRNFHEGRTWSYQTIKEIAAHFPYWSEKQVRLIIDKLVENKVLLRGNFNVNAYDRTAWYSFEDEAYFEIVRDICPNGQMEKTERANGFAQKGKPIPDNIPYKEKKKKKEDSISGIEFDRETKQFINISEADKAEWAKHYTGVDVDRELFQMRQWLLDPENPQRDGNRTFINNWLKRSFETPKKKPQKAKPQELETEDNHEGRPTIHYDSDIARFKLEQKGEKALINYLNKVSDPQHLADYLASRRKNES